MSTRDRHTETYPPGVPTRLDAVCQNFESEWLAGRRPLLQDFLAQVEDADRSALLRELLALEVEYRIRRGERPIAEDYLVRLPDYAALIKETFAAISLPALTTCLPPTASGISSGGELLDALREHQLLAPGQFEEFVRNLPSHLPAPRPLADDLLRRGWLSKYQAERLLDGQAHTLVLGPYVLLEQVGEGGMGTIYKAKHRPMDRLVALKLIRHDRLTQKEVRWRFEREARALAKLSHANIVTAYHAECIAGTSVLVMEYVEGTDLRRLVRESGPLGAGQACEFIRQAALGLQHAHENGLVHRDIKPSNLLLARQKGVIKLLDLGLVRCHADHLTAGPTEATQDGMILGTPDYMAPEQAMDPRGADIRADIYSLGCTLYFLLAGRSPFLGSPLAHKLLGHKEVEPPAIDGLQPGLPAGLAEVLRRLMAKLPEDRYQTPAEVAAALTPFALSDGSALPPMPPPPQPTPEKPRPASEQWASMDATSPLPHVGEILVQVGRMLSVRQRPEAGAAEAGPPTASDTPPERRSKRPEVDRRQMAKVLKRVGKMLMEVGKLLAVVLLVVGVVYYGATRFTAHLSSDSSLAEISELIGQDKFVPALQEIAQGGQDEKVKAQAREQVRRAALAWAELRLKDEKEPGQVADVLAQVLNLLGDDPHLKERLARAREVDVRQRVDAQLAEQHYKEAWDIAAGVSWGEKQKPKVIEKWLAGGELALKGKRLRQASNVAAAIPPEAGGARAAGLRKQAEKQINDVKSAVVELVRAGQFQAALKQLDEQWPSDEDQLTTKVVCKEWKAWIDLQKNDGTLAGAEKEFAVLAKRTSGGAQQQAAFEGLGRQVAAKRVRNIVDAAIAAKGADPYPAFEAAAKKLMDKSVEALANERTQLCQLLEKAWATRIEKEGDLAAKKVRYDRLVVSLLASETTKARIETLARDLNTSGTIAQAMRRLFAFPREPATAVKALEALSNLSGKQAVQRDILLKLLRLAAEGAEVPRGDKLAQFDQQLTTLTGLDPADVKTLLRVNARLFDLRVQQLIPTLGQKGKDTWQKALSDCDRVKEDPSTWVLACRVECLAELARNGDVAATKARQAGSALQAHLDKSRSAPGALGYALYARALAEWVDDQLPQGANLMVQAYGQGDRPELQVRQRRNRATEILQAATSELRTRNTDRDPFGSKGDADTAFEWLALANRLAGPMATPQLRRDLVLAAWYKTVPNIKLAGEVVSEVLKQNALGELTPQEAFRFALIHAHTRDDSLAGRQAAVASYMTALEKVRSLLRDKDGLEKEKIRVNVVRPVCKAFHDSVIQRLRTEKGREPFRAFKSKELEEATARLCAATGELIKAELPRWRALKIAQDWLPAVVDLYNGAFELASEPLDKAEYLVQKAYAYHATPNPSLNTLEEYARTARKIAPEHPGGYGLDGIVQIQRARHQPDWKEKSRLLMAGETDLNAAVARCEQLVKDKKLSKEKAQAFNRLFHHSLALTCLELSYYAPTQAAKANYLKRSEKSSAALLKIDARNLEAWGLHGLLLEDMGLFVGPAAEYYEKACAALARAMDEANLKDGRTKPWLDRGRVQFRWAKLGGKDKDKHLTAAAKDFERVIEWGGESVEAAEAYHWFGQLHELRAQAALAAARTMRNDAPARRTHEAAARKEARAAGDAYARGIAMSAKSNHPEMARWREELLFGGSLWALAKAGTLYQQSADEREVEKYLQLAEVRATELQDKFSEPRAAWLLLGILRSRGEITKKFVNEAQLSGLVARALDRKRPEGKRSQDDAWRVAVLLVRGQWYMSGGWMEKQRNLAKAQADAQAALKIAKDSPYVLASTKGVAAALAADAACELWNLWFAEKQRADAQGTAVGPEPPDPYAPVHEALKLKLQPDMASKLKATLAAALYNRDALEKEKAAPSLVRRANCLAEAAQLIAEADDEIQQARKTLPPGIPHPLEDFVGKGKAATNKRALPVLQQAVADKTAAGNGKAETWRWQWQLAALLDGTSGNRSAATVAIQAAQDSAPAEYQARIRTLAKKLKQSR